MTDTEHAASDAGGPTEATNGPSAKPRERARIPGRAWLKVLLAFGLAAIAVVVVPRLGDPAGSGPAVATLLGAAALVAAVTGAGMYVVIRRDLRLGVAAAVYAAGYNVLIVAVKFVAAPLGFYEVNRDEAFSQLIAPIGTGLGTILTAGIVGVLYIAAFVIIYRIVRRRLTADAAPETSRQGRKWLVPLIVGTAIIGTVVAGGWVILVLLLGDAVGYLMFVLTSSFAILIGLVLAIASALVALVFREAGERERVVGNASLLVSVFWLGLAFLALYHVLWVVYILILTTLWPLKVVTPK